MQTHTTFVTCEVMSSLSPETFKKTLTVEGVLGGRHCSAWDLNAVTWGWFVFKNH